jgi:uridine kinase
MKESPIFIGIAGGTASGKTTFAKQLASQLGLETVLIISLDDYYHCQREYPINERAKRNYDHPEAIDFDLLFQHLQSLQTGEMILAPRYDFTTHTRQDITQKMAPRPYIIVEGILTLYHPHIASLFDYKVFIEAPTEVRLTRRIRRDMSERGRTEESVRHQWSETVEPMFLRFCLPSSSSADYRVAEESFYQKTLLITHLCRESHRQGIEK